MNRATILDWHFILFSIFHISFQELPWCSALPSPLRVCTTCCGLSPIFCSQHLFGALKCKRASGLVRISHVGRPLAHLGDPRFLLNAMQHPSSKCSRFTGEHLFYLTFILMWHLNWRLRIKIRDNEDILMFSAVFHQCCINTVPRGFVAGLKTLFSSSYLLFDLFFSVLILLFMSVKKMFQQCFSFPYHRIL